MCSWAFEAFFFHFIFALSIFFSSSSSFQSPTRPRKWGQVGEKKSKSKEKKSVCSPRFSLSTHTHKNEKKNPVHLYPIPSRFSLFANVFNWIYYCCCCFWNRIAHRRISSGLTLHRTQRIRLAHTLTRARSMFLLLCMERANVCRVDAFLPYAK